MRVIVAWHGDCSHRRAALSFVCRRYARPTYGLGGSPWVKALAVMPAIASSRSEIVVVTDADVFTDGLEEAVQAVRDGAPWAIPYRGVLRLTKEATARVLAGEEPDGLPLEQSPYLGVEGGGIVVAHREALLEVPLDPRFIGWGQEDESWGLALRALLGPPKRIKGPLWHLWHPPQPRLSRSRGSQESWQLRRRYYLARNDPTQMRALLDEVKDAHATHQPAVCARQAA